MNWYSNWHKHPRHKHAHWIFFFATLLLVSSFLFGELGNFYLEKEYIAQAQTSLTITQNGESWSVNGNQKFLLFVSYFDALGASQATLNSDFVALKSRGFDGIRVLINWPCGSCAGSTQYRLLNPDGSYRAGMLARLTNLLQTAQNNGLVVDLTFHDWGNFDSLQAYQTGLTNTTRDTMGFRGVIFDLENENFTFTNLTVSQALTLRNAVKAVDPNRLVTLSLASFQIGSSGSAPWFIGANLDFVAFHDNRSGDWPGETDNVVNNIRASLGSSIKPIFLDEPERYRNTTSFNNSASDWFTAAKNAKCAGAAAWTFHNAAGFDLTGGTIFSQFNSVESQIANGINAELNSTTWFSCAIGGTLPPPPPPTGPPPPPPVTPPPTGTPTTRSIYFLTPSSAPSGSSITISGSNLTTSVNFINTNGGNTTTAIGTIDRYGTEVVVTIPPLAIGKYMVSVGSSPTSNQVQLDVSASVPPPPPKAAGTTSAVPCDPATIAIANQNNVTIVCDFFPESAYPGDTIIMTGAKLTSGVQLAPVATGIITNISGTVSNNGELVTFILPANTIPNTYTLGNAGVSGSATLTKTFAILGPPPTDEQPPVDPGLPFKPLPNFSPPPATSFEKLFSSAFNYSLILVGIAVFAMIMWGGFLWLTSAANPANIGTAKKYITNAVLGAVLLISSYAILYTVNPELVGGRFNLEGLQVPTSQATALSRFVATDEVGAASAVNAGCIIDLDTRDFAAVNCPIDVGTSNLVPDPIFTANDTNANNQIGATTIQNNGNLGSGRKIVVLDSGYNYNHPDLSSSYLGGKDFVNNDSDPMDDNNSGASSPGHGSHVAGIITGDGNDPQVRGVAPQAGIIAGKILDNKGDGTWSKTVEAIYWAVNGPDGIFGTPDDFRADAINMSIGGAPFSSFCDNADSTSMLMAKAFQYARDNGVLPIIAAGNSPSGVAMPGCINAAFTVGAVDGSDRIANFSGRGSPVDIVAPGVNIYSSLLGTNNGLKSGTSMATPVVSGVAALIKNANPSFTVAQLEQNITSTACDLGPTGKDNEFGWGRVSLSPASCTPPPPPPPPSGAVGTITTTPTACTKGIAPGNPNCNVTLSYTITGITAATQLTVGKDNNFFQNIQCASSPCSGQLTDTNPNAGLHQYDFRLPNYTVIARGNVYIYTRGTIATNFRSCAKQSNINNRNCDVTINITAPGVTPNSVVITKDGTNWRLVQCNNPTCSVSVVDANPALGNHTYTVRDASDNSNGRLGRASVSITDGGPPVPGPAIRQCNATGTTCLNGQYWPAGSNSVCGNSSCVVLDHQVAAQDITGGYNGGILMRRNNFQIYVVDGTRDPDLPAGTRLDIPAPGNGTYTYQMWDGGLGNPAQQRILVSITIPIGTTTTSPTGVFYNTVVLCSGPNYTGTCDAFAANNPDLRNSLVGNDTASSILLNIPQAKLCADINYGGSCEYFTASDPDLSNNIIGDDSASSIGAI